ncbi:MAG: MerR family transcriptional regulator [Hyphomicrobiaceae bacterium]|nr:MerR family transcriptional regulator [Hyphomicrobiaceae bacterium]
MTQALKTEIRQKPLTVSELSALSGVSVRTLHHYDAIGLLHPAEVGQNGYRYYGRSEVLRLQQVLFYRELGLPLAEIRQTLDAPDFDLERALVAHRARLVADIARRTDLIETIDKTLEDLDGETTMTQSNPFKGFAPEKQKQYENELIDRYGDGARARIAESHAKVGKLSKEQMQAIQDEGHQVNLDLVALIDAGEPAESAKVQQAIARHHQWVSHFWTPNAEAYAGLGELYLDHPDFRAFYDKYDPRLVDFLAEAMRVYSETTLD